MQLSYCKRCQQFQDDIGALIHQPLTANRQDCAAAGTSVNNDGDRFGDGAETEDVDVEAESILPAHDTPLINWPSYETILFDSLEELRGAYNSPCPLCRRVFSRIDKHDWPKLNAFNMVNTVLVFSSKKGKPTLSARLDTNPTSKTLKYADIEPVRSARKLKYLGDHLAGLEEDDPLLETLNACAALENGSTGSKGSLEMAKFWLTECIYGHPNCERDFSGWLPTRLIDVGDADAELMPRLVETSTLSSPSSEGWDVITFVALSHCWGAKQIITTTMATFDDRKRGIEWKELSRTFQDAIVTTRGMGQRYIWIDSLCIIQDSVEDWMAESVQMCTVYERALFTVMAAHASGGADGCFVKRDGFAQLPLTLRFDSPDKMHSQVACFQLPDHGQGLWPRFSPVLFTRAWVLQEQFNSRARLIFFGDQVHWECRTMCGSEQRPLDGKKIWDLVSGPGSLAVQEEDDPADWSTGMHKKWYELVRNYSRRGITKSSDRLIAIDGIAQSLQKRASDRYIAGLWSDGLPAGLMWYIPWRLTKSGSWHALEKETKTFLCSRHELELAPSWSWASVTPPIDWFPLYSKPINACDVLQADAQGSPFHSHGTLILRGMTRRLFVAPYYQSLHFTGTRTQNPKIKEYDVHNMTDDGKRASHICYASTRAPSWRHRLSPYPIEFFPDEILDPTQPVTFIALGYTPAAEMHKKRLMPHFHSLALAASQRSIYTLALQTVPSSPDTYRRVGFATWNNCSWFGYFCVHPSYSLEFFLRLRNIQEVHGLIAMLLEIPSLLLACILGSLFGQAIVQFHVQGPVWYRELVRGNGGRHEHDGEIRDKETYREGWEAEERTIRIV
ncbi:HET-domain-containing protein [Bimuria novae-zelandiae CBS 107.79]|uniref:HET-domain-containing protein n=1 Tax=Bimuria novae-zelandiae CBS 107.79 TaxID=1447943 RepID=A0A6A5USL8_9PLEO|nr:HET-domain-containing protein [Bimuria novae-zelandiae CBS 107.79]